MFTQFDVLETIDMVEREHLDIRTITMGLSLFSCVRSTAEETAKNVYDLVCRRAEKIVKTASELSGEYGIPIVNKRVSVTPVSLISAAFPEKAPLIGKALDEGSHQVLLSLPYDKGGILDMLYREAKVDNVEYGETILVQTTCTPKVLGQVNAYVMEQKESE